MFLIFPLLPKGQHWPLRHPLACQTLLILASYVSPSSQGQEVGLYNYLHLKGPIQVATSPFPLIFKIKKKQTCYLGETSRSSQMNFQDDNILQLWQKVQ